jgi:glycosyltransferase involved in cell wall biosynthesis
MLANALSRTGIESLFADYIGAFFPLSRNLRRSGAEILHVHWIAEIAGVNEANPVKYILKQLVFRLDIVLARLLSRGRVVWTVHNLRAHERRHVEGDLSSRRFLARQATRLVAHSPSARTAVSDTYGVPPERVVVVPHGNYIGWYPNEASRDESRHHLGIVLDRFVFLHFGSLRPYKDLEGLIDSFERLDQPRKHLVIAGPASDADYLATLRERAVRAGVRLESRFIDDRELQFFFNAADVVVLPFRDVLTSGSLVLAMSFGRMVVAPRLPSISDYADPEGSILYDQAQLGGLDFALARAMSTDVEAYGRHNLERARHLDWEEAAARTARIYADLNPLAS